MSHLISGQRTKSYLPGDLAKHSDVILILTSPGASCSDGLSWGLVGQGAGVGVRRAEYGPF